MNRFNLMGPGSRSDVIPYELNDLKRFYTMNTGNMLFFYACEQLLSLAVERYGWGGDFENINSGSDGVVLPMANQIGTHFDLKSSGPKIDKIRKPVVAMGLGAQLEFNEDNLGRVPRGSVEWLEDLSSKSKAKNISVRGENTFRFMERMGLGDSTVVLGCPSLLINQSLNLGEKIKNKFIDWKKNSNLCGVVSVAAGDPYHKNLKLANLERSLISLIEENSGTYIVQNPGILIKLCSDWYGDIEDVEYELLRNRWFPGRENQFISNWFKRYAINFISVPQWIYYYSQRSIVIGTRIHGVQTAIQAGTPAICLYIDARTKELCEVMKIPHAPAELFSDGITNEDISGILTDWDECEFDDNRKMLAIKTRDFLKSNGVEYKKSSLIGSV